MSDLVRFQEIIGYEFKDISLLEQALTHSSFANENRLPKGSDNERMEFLGDAVLEIVSSEFLYLNYKELPEGKLSSFRASLVCEASLFISCKDIDIASYIRMSKGEETTGGRKRASILTDAFEAVIGAIYLDGGIEPAAKFIKATALNDIEHKKLYHDSKTKLQEVVQAHFSGGPSYVLVKEDGPDHMKSYTVALMVQDKEISQGSGSSKKAAEQDAAYKGLLHYSKMFKID